MNDYITVSEIAEIWQITPRRIQTLCAQGAIEGAVKFGRSWAVPRDAKRPADHREKQFRTYARGNGGFTLLEMLVVIAIIAVLVAVVIPTVNGSSEKSRDAVDMANVRAAYSAVAMAAMTNDTSAVFEGREVYDSFSNTYSVRIPLKQQKTGWDTGDVNIAGLAQGNARWLGTPKAGGSCRVYGDNGNIIINWNGDAVMLDKRWTFETTGGTKYLNAAYQEIPADNYKASVVSEMLNVKTNDVINCSSIDKAGSLLDTKNYKYSIGFFVVDTSATNEKGQYKVLRDSGEIAFPEGGGVFTIGERGGDLKVAIQLFKKPVGSDKPVAMTETEAAALHNLLSLN